MFSHRNAHLHTKSLEQQKSSERSHDKLKSRTLCEKALVRFRFSQTLCLEICVYLQRCKKTRTFLWVFIGRITKVVGHFVLNTRNRSKRDIVQKCTCFTVQVEGTSCSSFYRSLSVHKPLSLWTYGIKPTSYQRLGEKPRISLFSQTLYFNVRRGPRAPMDPFSKMHVFYRSK